MIIGLISDTHGVIRPEALKALKESELIIHAGDVGKQEVLDALAAIAPVVAVRGNCDAGGLAAGLPETETIRIGIIKILVIHDIRQLQPDKAANVDVVICGHSHIPVVEAKEKVLVVNPGSAGRRRFRLPITVGRLLIDGDVQAEIVPLEDDYRMGRR